MAKTQFLYQFTIFGTRSKKKVLGFKKRNNLEYITQKLVFGWVRIKQGRTGLGTSNEKQKNDKMGTITGTLAIELAWNKKKNMSFMHALRAYKQ